MTAIDEAGALARVAADLPGIRLCDILAYEGHLLNVADPAERAARMCVAMDPILATRVRLEGEGLSVEVILGGTSTFAITRELDGFDEIQAGSYVFMDNAYGQLRDMREHFEQA